MLLYAWLDPCPPARLPALPALFVAVGNYEIELLEKQGELLVSVFPFSSLSFRLLQLLGGCCESLDRVGLRAAVLRAAAGSEH
jgi:hypothetical protein